MTQRRRSKKTEVEPRRFGRRSFLLGAGAAACVGAGLWLRRKELSEQDKAGKQQQNVNNSALPAGEWRAVWISYLEWALLDFSTADTFRTVFSPRPAQSSSICAPPARKVSAVEKSRSAHSR